MRIDRVTLREIRMPLVHYFETSFGRTTERNIVLVEIDAEGTKAWGECVAGEHPFYSEESYETAWYVLKEYFAPAVIGKQIESARAVPALLQRVRGHRMAKAALENAAWEAEAMQKKIPLWKLIGGTRSEIDCGVSIGIQDTVDQLLAKIETELAAGYQRIKVKCKPGWDVDVFRRIRETVERCIEWVYVLELEQLAG